MRYEAGNRLPAHEQPQPQNEWKVASNQELSDSRETNALVWGGRGANPIFRSLTFDTEVDFVTTTGPTCLGTSLCVWNGNAEFGSASDVSGTTTSTI